jgi:hypothetical protein
MLESKIQSAIIKKLQSLGYLVIKLIKTNTNGIPDLIVHRNGRTAYIEVKRPGEKPRDLQLYRMKQLQDHGIPTLTCTSVEECLLKLQNIM